MLKFLINYENFEYVSQSKKRFWGSFVVEILMAIIGAILGLCGMGLFYHWFLLLT